MCVNCPKDLFLLLGICTYIVISVLAMNSVVFCRSLLRRGMILCFFIKAQYLILQPSPEAGHTGFQDSSGRSIYLTDLMVTTPKMSHVYRDSKIRRGHYVKWIMESKQGPCKIGSQKKKSALVPSTTWKIKCLFMPKSNVCVIGSELCASIPPQAI